MAIVPNERSRATSSRALLDTTVQVDRVKYGARRSKLERLLGEYDLRFATSLSLVEFKATVIQECITIHNQLRAKGACFTQARDALLEKNHRQLSLRTHIFNNYLAVFARSSFEIDQEQDKRMAEEARLLLENTIVELFTWFSSEESVDSILRDKLRCDRAREAPVKRTAAFSPTLPRCERGRNKTCRVEALIRAEAPALIEKLRPSLVEPNEKSKATAGTQLQNAVELFESVIEDANKELSVNDCRCAGDCLIAIEAAGSATHALSSNAKEWRPISDALDFEFVHITYPEERTR